MVVKTQLRRRAEDVVLCRTRADQLAATRAELEALRAQSRALAARMRVADAPRKRALGSPSRRARAAVGARLAGVSAWWNSIRALDGFRWQRITEER